MCAKMSSFSPDSLLLPHRVWKVKFVGKKILNTPLRVSYFAFNFAVSLGFTLLENLKEGGKGCRKTMYVCGQRKVLKMLGSKKLFKMIL